MDRVTPQVHFYMQIEVGEGVVAWIDDKWLYGTVVQADREKNSYIIEYINVDREILQKEICHDEIRREYAMVEPLPVGTRILALWYDEDRGVFCRPFYEARTLAELQSSESFIIKCEFKGQEKEEFVDARSIFIL